MAVIGENRRQAVVQRSAVLYQFAVHVVHKVARRLSTCSGRAGPGLPVETKTVRAEPGRSANDQWPS
jgi:hypothetical protein